jgi:type II secretory pathway pseudopilin PulG
MAYMIVSKKMSLKEDAFSLVEVVVAVGVFAIAVVAVIGMLVPINQSIANVQDGDDASRVAQVIQSELQKASFSSVQGFIKNGTVLYANKAGSIVAPDADPKWDADGVGGVTLYEQSAKFFQIKLELNADLSPNGDDTALYAGGFLAFTIVMRWPGYTGDGRLFAQADQQSILIIPAAVTR